ncbi:MAG TPA: ATP-binding protein [Candidatus Binataceae bacterium]|nr:ATP-binding protein [Candidatus Binataceae bacterium]
MLALTAQTNNIKKLAAATEALITRAPGAPGAGIISGVSGAGKTTAVAWLANRVNVNAVHVRAIRVWTPLTMLESILFNLGIAPNRKCAHMVHQIVEGLATTGRSLFVDEADYLLKRPELVDILRDLHDLSTEPLILIGMADFLKNLDRWPQLKGRVGQKVEFLPPDLSDVKEYVATCGEIDLSDDAVEWLHETHGGTMRSLEVGLEMIERLARKHGLKKVHKADVASVSAPFPVRGRRAAA